MAVRYSGATPTINCSSANNNGYSRDVMTHVYSDTCDKGYKEMCVNDNKNINELYGHNRINVCVAGYRIQAMVDTGSSISAISTAMLNKINKIIPVKTEAVNKICTLADGSDIALEHVFIVPVVINNVTYNVKLYILPVQHIDMIIGHDVLAQQNAIIDYKRNVVIIQNNIVPSNKCISSDVCMLGQLETTETHCMNLLVSGCHWLESGHSSKVTLKTNQVIDRGVNNIIIPRLPINIQIANILPNINSIKTIITNNTPNPLLVVDNECIAMLHETSEVPKMTENVRLKDKIKDINLTNVDINGHQKQKLIELLNSYTDVFANNLKDIGRTNLICYDVEVPLDAKPIRLRQYQTPYKHRGIIEEHINELLDADLIRPAKSVKWGHPVILVSKARSNKLRLCVDVRKLNAITETLSYPTLDIQNFLADIGSKRCQYFSCIDLKSAYNQIPLSKRTSEILTMTTPCGEFSPTTAMFGLKNLPHVFSRLMDLIFQDIKYKYLGYYQDDLIIFSTTYEDHLSHIGEVLRRLRTANLCCDPNKSKFFQATISFIGYSLSRNGIHTCDHNIEKVKQFQPCKSQRDCRAWLGLMGFYRRFLKDYAAISRPIVELTKKQTGKFVWTDEAQKAFVTLRDNLINAPLLALPDMSSKEPFSVTVDSSSIAVAFCMSQKSYWDKAGKVVDRPIIYGGTSLKHNQKKFGSSELELLGVTYAIGKLDNYLRGRKFNLYTDHKALGYIIKKPIDKLRPSLARKVIFLQQYEFELFHVPGKSIPHVDALSRHVYSDAETERSDIEPEICAIKPTVNEVCVIKQNGDKHILDVKDLRLENFTVESIKEAQKKDYLFMSLYNFIKHDRLPNDRAMTKKVRTHHNEYVIHQGLLYHIGKNKQGTMDYQQICVPIEFRTQIMKIHHDLNTAGHMATFKMFNKAKMRFYWQNMYTDMQNYVSSCKLCLQSNTGHPPKVALKSLPVVTEPFTSIHIDLLRFHTTSAKNQYVIVIIDAFTHFVTMRSVRNKSAKTVANFLFEEYFLKYGFPQLIATPTTKRCVMDNGTDVLNNLTKALSDIMGVKMVTTSFYNPRCNSQLERYNRTIISILRKLAADEPQSWSKHLPYVAHAINNSVCESTGHIPFQLLYGMPMRDVVDVCVPRIPENAAKNTKQAYTYFLDKVERIRKYAVDNMHCAKQHQEKYYNKHCRRNYFSPGDKVYVKICGNKVNDDPKLKQQYEGPYIISEFISPTNAILLDKNGNKLPRSTLINNLKRCQVRKQFDKPTVASHISSSDTEVASFHNDTDDNNDDDESPYNSDDSSASDRSTLSDVDADDEDDTEMDWQEEENNKHSVSQGEEKTLQDDTSLPNTSQAEDDTIVQSHGTAPAKEQHQLTDDTFHEIKTVFRKKVLPSGEEQYYVSFRHAPAKKHRQWISRNDLTPELKAYVDSKKLPVVKSRINVIELRDTKTIRNDDDWLSIDYILPVPITMEIDYKNELFYCEARSVNELYTFLSCIIKDHVYDIHKLDARLLCMSINKVLECNANIKQKLYDTHGKIINESCGVTMYTALLLLIREHHRIRNNDGISIDVSCFNNPVCHLFGNVSDNLPEVFVVRSNLEGLPDCLPDMCGCDLDTDTIKYLRDLQKKGLHIT